MIENIHIYHTNDIHSHFENWPRIKEFLSLRMQEHNTDSEEVFLFDIGDHVDRWHPYTEATLGKGNVQLLNEMEYTAVTIGNNEGITLANKDLDTLYQEAQFDVLVSNLYTSSHTRPSWTLPYKIYQSKSGLKIGVIGVTAYFKKLYELLGWNLGEPLQELEKHISSLHSKADIIILLSHLGIHDDEKIAIRHPEIDIILGGHTHHILPQGRIIDNGLTDTLLGAAGKHGNYVGYVNLKINTLTKKIVNKSAFLTETKQMPAPINEKESIQYYLSEGKQLLSQEILTVPFDLEVDWFKDSPLPALLCEGINEWCEADCSFINAGLVLDKLEKGGITKFDLHRILPHPINPCLVELSGKELEVVIRQTLDPKWPTFELKGLGFRGKILGNFIYHQISFNTNTDQIFIKGNPIDLQKTYRLGTIDMYTFGHIIPNLLEAKKKYFMPEFLRDVLEWKLKREFKK